MHILLNLLALLIQADVVAQVAEDHLIPRDDADDAIRRLLEVPYLIDEVRELLVHVHLVLGVVLAYGCEQRV